MKHLVITFHDCTFECVFSEDESARNKVIITRKKAELIKILEEENFI